MHSPSSHPKHQVSGAGKLHPETTEANIHSLRSSWGIAYRSAALRDERMQYQKSCSGCPSEVVDIGMTVEDFDMYETKQEKKANNVDA